MNYARKLIAPLAVAAALAAAAAPALAAPSGRTCIAAGSAKKTPLVGQARGLRRRRLRDVRRHDAGVRAEGAHGDALRPPAEAASTAGGGWTALRGIPSFGVWDGADPGVPGFIVRKRVGGLQPGNAYRAVVRFRWRNPRGKVVRAAKRVTARCAASRPAPRPAAAQRGRRARQRRRELDLPRGRRQHGQRPGRRVRGRARVRHVRRRVQPARSRRWPPAPARSWRSRRRAASPATASRFTADYAGLIAESREDNNVLARRCAAR